MDIPEGMRELEIESCRIKSMIFSRVRFRIAKPFQTSRMVPKGMPTINVGEEDKGGGRDP